VLRAVADAGAFGGRWACAVRVCVVSAFVGLLVFAGVAQAGEVHPFVASFAAGSNPQAITVDQATGDVLVVDVGAGAVLKFDSAGSPADFSALSSNVLDGAGGADQTPHGAFAFDSNSAAQVAVDHSGGPADGFVYVANLSGAVDVFDSTGTFVGEIDGTAASPQSGGEVCGVAVDPGGHVYAGYFSGHVDKYTPADANPADDTFDGQLADVDHPCNVAADGLGNVYASRWDTGPLTKYDASQIGQPSASGGVVDARSLAVAVDPSNSDVYVDEGDHVAQYDSTGALIGQSGNGKLSGSSFGVAIDRTGGSTDDDLYASDAGTGQVHQFGSAVVVPPFVTIDPPSNITTSHATFTGTVNPGGTDPTNDTTWHFEYSTDGGITWTSTTGGDVGTGTSPVAVSDEVSLLAHQSVKVRLVATSTGSTTTSSEQDFDTPTVLPDVVTQPAQDITPDHAALTATLNPHNAPTTYFFEYGPSTAYGTSIPAGQNGDGGSSPETISVQQNIYGLQPGTTYHYRVVAHDQAGTATGADQTFTTTTPRAASAKREGIPGTGLLPENRGWEQVSPTDKHGGDVLIDSARVRAAATETPDKPMATTFGSLNAFADVHGIGAGNDYMAIRTGQTGTQGWATHGITPPQQPLGFGGILHGFDPQWQGDLSADLNSGVVNSATPLTDAPDVKDVPNLYRRQDLRTPGVGAYQLLTDCPLCAGTPLPPANDNSQIPFLAGASADFSHIAFESSQALVAGATPDSSNLYEWANGTLRFVGILPDTACGSPPCYASVSTAGRDGGAGPTSVGHTPRTVSTDGSRIIFTDMTGTVLGAGERGNLYMRIDGTSTIQLNIFEKTPTPPQPPANDAVYQTASADGSRVFFSSSEELTDAPLQGAEGLYMYDLNAPADHHLTLLSVDHEPADPPNSVLGVMGASDDGHYVYFICAGQLVAGQPTLRADLGIYEWHDGALSYVGRLADLNQTQDESNSVFPNAYGKGPMTARVTPNGRYVLFQSSTGAGLTGYDSNKHVELYLYNAGSHELQCASCRPDGSPARGGASDVSRTFTGATNTTSYLNRAVTDSGRVFFTTTDSLVSQDVNGRSDAYEFDSASGTVHLLSGGTERLDSYFMDASASGDDAFFLSRQQLVGWDTDQNYDLYDARVDGGMPDPASPPGCSDDPCQGPLSSGSLVGPQGSQTLQGAGNVRSVAHKAKRRPVRCRRGFVRKRVKKKVRCVRAPKKHKKHKTHKTAHRAGHVERAVARRGQ
jgi:hypothetical protein